MNGVRALVYVRWKCAEFGINDSNVRLSEWPELRRMLGWRLISARVVGSLV